MEKNQKESSIKYLKRKYHAGKFGNIGWGEVSKQQGFFLIRKLVQNETLESLRNIFSGVEARYESMKQLNVMVTIVLFITTIIVGNITFLIQSTMKQVDWSHETIMLKTKAKIELLEKTSLLKESLKYNEEEIKSKNEQIKVNNEKIKAAEELYQEKREIYNEVTDKQGPLYVEILGEINSLYIFFIFAIVLYALFFIVMKWHQYLWVSSIYGCVKEAYKQKEELETGQNDILKL